MKTVINIVLAACVIGLIYVCYGSIMGPINFDDAKKTREKQVIARLIDIRKAQLEYRNLHNGRYTASFDTLIDFVKTAKLPFVKKEGVLSDTQLEAGMTEKKAMAIINKAKKTGNWKEVEKEGLMNFKRDTLWVAVTDTIYAPGFNADSLRYVPFGTTITPPPFSYALSIKFCISFVCILPSSRTLLSVNTYCLPKSLNSGIFIS